MKEIRNRFKILTYFAALTKIRIPLAVSMSTLAGYALKEESITSHAILPVLGVFFLSSSSAALNSWQERKYDAMMTRTENRPLPAKNISQAVAILFILCSLLLGMFLIFRSGGYMPAFIGLITFLWYNLLYTPLKRVTSFALFIGAFVGAFPPLIGWTASGGNLADIRILSLSLMVFIWQVPHFMLLLLYHGNDYSKAGFQVLSTYLSQKQIKRLIKIWILATSLAVIPMGFSGVVRSAEVFMILLALSVILLIWFLKLLSSPSLNYRRAFMLINVYLILVFLLITADHLI